MGKRNTLKHIGLLIEWHWLFIMKDRKRMNHFLDTGYKLSSKKVLRLYAHLSYHCNQVSELELHYNRLAKALDLNKKNMILEAI